MEPARLSPTTRTTLRIVGSALAVLGLALMVFGTIRMFGSFGGDVETASRGGLGGFATVAGGMLLLFVGVVLLRFGFLKPYAEILATETGDAVQYSAHRAGQGLSSGLEHAAVRVRCRNCGYLESEDARFCSGCAQAM